MTEDTSSVYILRATKDLFIISIRERVRIRVFPGHASFIGGIFLSPLLLVIAHQMRKS